MDGIPALDLWDLVTEVFHSSPNQNNKTEDQKLEGNLLRNSTLHTKNQNSTMHADLDLSNVDHVSSNVRPSRFDNQRQKSNNEIRVKNPQSREIQIRYIDTKHQLADMLTKGHFTRDEGNHLLHFSTSAISALAAALRASA